MKMEHVVGSFLIFTLLATLIFQSYSSLEDYYGFTPDDTEDGKTIIEKLKNINVIAGIEEFLLGVYKIANPTSLSDIYGGLKAVGAGLIKLASGVIIFPAEIFGIITGFYYIPPIFGNIIGLLLGVYVGFILVQKYMGA